MHLDGECMMSYESTTQFYKQHYTHNTATQVLSAIRLNQWWSKSDE